MRFVHIADLHLGKVLHQYSLIEKQRELLFELLEYMKEEDIHHLIIAGDVYDRLIPSQEAIRLLDEFLTKALLHYHIEIYMISGNHDSSERLHFASSILGETGLHIETYLNEKITYIEKDNIRFYLLPFIKPSQVKSLFNTDDIHNYQDALHFYMQQQTIDSSYKNILITHQFVGKTSLTSDSEIPLSVGGSEIIDASLFTSFDYVALGHLHAPQKVSRETIRYSGSLMRYSFDEVKQNKSIVVVDTDDMSIHLHELHPTQNLCRYQGTFEQFMDPTYITSKNDFLSFELENETLIPHAIDQLRSLYPYLLQITYSYILRLESNMNHKTIQSIEQMDRESLFETFYKDIKDQDLNQKQKQTVHELLDKVGENNENH